MKKGCNSQFLYGDNGEHLGINLGADAWAEHESGIYWLKMVFGTMHDWSEKIFGVERRLVSKFPQSLVFKEFKQRGKAKSFILIYDTGFDGSHLPLGLQHMDDTDMVCAWDESSFGIRVSERYKNELAELYDAFCRKDITIGMGEFLPFNNGGLIFTIASRIPAEARTKAYEKDIDHYNLLQAAEKTGIHKILEKAGKKYFALSPRWADDTKKEVRFWLNPMHQQLYDYGDFSVEELKEWAKDKGPVMIKK